MASAPNIYCGLAGKNAQAVLQTERGRWLLLLFLGPSWKGHVGGEEIWDRHKERQNLFRLTLIRKGKCCFTSGG